MRTRSSRTDEPKTGLGLDFGTSTCKLVHFEDDVLHHVEIDRRGGELMPSVVLLRSRGGHIYGSDAEQMKESFTGKLCFPSQRQNNLPIKLLLGDDTFNGCKAGSKKYSATDMAEGIMGHIAEEARTLGYESKVCLTRPAYFIKKKEDLIKQAAIAGTWRVEHVIAEPCAAAIAHCWRHNISGNMLVYDYGGGTFDCAVLRIDSEKIQVLAKLGNFEVGGEMMRRQIYDSYLMPKIEEILGEPLKEESLAGWQSWRKSREIIKQLSMKEEVNITIDVEDVVSKGTQAVVGSFEFHLTREQFEQDVAHHINATIENCAEAVRCAGLTARDLDIVLMVGGVSRMPLVQRAVAQWADGAECLIADDPDFAVAEGAALLHAGVVQREISDVLARSLRIRIPKSLNTRSLLGTGSPMPTSDQPVILSMKWTGQGPCSIQLELCEGEKEKFGDNEPLPTLLVTSKNSVSQGAKIGIEIWSDNDGSWQSRAFVSGRQRIPLETEWEASRKTTPSEMQAELIEGGRLDCVLCLDMTDSVCSKIREMVCQEIIDLEERLRNEGCDVRFGIVAFGDAACGEEVKTLPLTGLEGVLERRLSNALPNYQGGDAEEDVEVALQQALQMLRTSTNDTNKCIILITDADVRDDFKLAEIISRASEINIRCFTICPFFFENYIPFAEKTQGALKEPWSFLDVCRDISVWVTGRNALGAKSI